MYAAEFYFGGLFAREYNLSLLLFFFVFSHRMENMMTSMFAIMFAAF